MTIAADLFALQELDSAIDACDHELEQIRAQFGESEPVAETRVQIARQEVELRAIQHRAKELEDDITDQRAKIAPVEAKLYDGSVRLPKELQGYQEELDMLVRHLRALEDQELAVLELLEGIAAALAASRERLGQLEGSWQQDQQRLHERERELENERARHLAQRQSRAVRIDPPRLAQYEHLRPMKRGRAVVKIDRGVCTGCRISLPSTILQRARSGMQVVHCTSCERILYAG